MNGAKKKNFRETALAMLVIGAIFVGSIFLSNHFFRTQIIHQQTTLLENKLMLLLEHFPEEDSLETNTITKSQKKLLKNYIKPDNTRFTLLGADKKIIYDTSGDPKDASRADRPEIIAVAKGSPIGTSLRASKTLDKEFLYVALPIKKEGQIIGYARLSEQVSNFSKNIAIFRQYIIGTLALLFIVIAIFVRQLIKQKNEPLETILPVLKKMVEQPEQERSIIHESNSWSELYTTVNRLSTQMSSTYQAYVSTEEQFYEFIDQLTIGVFIIKHDGTIELMNPAMCRLIGVYNPVGKNYFSVFTENELLLLLQQTITDKQTRKVEIRLTKPKLSVIDLSLRYVEPKANSTIQLIGAAYDITQLRHLERMQRDFVGNVSHELKTPVTSLIGFTETLLDGAKDDPELTTQFLQIIQKDAIRLQRLIAEILLLSRDGDIPDKEVQTVFMKPFLQELLSNYQKQIQAKNLTVEILGNTEYSYQTKLEIFQPIIKNLLENAIQYSKENGKITISYETTENQLKLAVKDTGIGIDSRNQKRIFERFYRVDKARSRNSGGTGLGLSIVQNYTELLGGYVELTSALGLGSVFTVYLPLN